MARHRKNIYEVEFLNLSVAADQNADSQNGELALPADVYEISFAAIVSVEEIAPQEIGNLCLGYAGISFHEIAVAEPEPDGETSRFDTEKPSLDTTQILVLPELIKEVLNTLQLVDGRVSMPQILDTIRAIGVSLDLDGLHDFMQLFSEHPSVIPRPDGDFAFKNSLYEYCTSSINSMSNGQRSDQAMSTVEIVQALKSIDKSEELKRVKAFSQIANNRRRGHNRKSNFKKRQGKTHGHKKTIEELIDEMNAKNQPST